MARVVGYEGEILWDTTTYLETLTAQQSLLSAQLSLISDKYDKLQAGISLYQALGGGRDK